MLDIEFHRVHANLAIVEVLMPKCFIRIGIDPEAAKVRTFYYPKRVLWWNRGSWPLELHAEGRQWVPRHGNAVHWKLVFDHCSKSISGRDRYLRHHGVWLNSTIYISTQTGEAMLFTKLHVSSISSFILMYHESGKWTRCHEATTCFHPETNSSSLAIDQNQDNELKIDPCCSPTRTSVRRAQAWERVTPEVSTRNSLLEAGPR